MQSPSTLSAPDGEAAPRRPVRVLHCIPTLAVGGAETQLRLLAPRFAARGLGVGIVGRFAGHDVETLSAKGVACFPVRGAGNYNPAIVAALLRAVATLRPTVIQTWLTQMDIVAGLVARTYGIPWIVAERSSPPAYPPTLKNRLRRRLGRHAVIVANAPQGLDVWPGRPDGLVIGNGVDLAAVRAVPRGLMREMEPFRGRFSVVTVSRLVPEKNLGVLIAAVALARDETPHIRLIIVGDGPDRPRLEAMVAERGLADTIVFAGFRASPVEWVRSADLFASASRFEGHPNAVTEAAAAGVPTILSDIAMHRSLMGDAALYAPVDDAHGFAAHLVALAGDGAACDTVVAAGHRVAAEFDIDAAAALYAVLYARLTSGAPPD